MLDCSLGMVTRCCIFSFLKAFGNCFAISIFLRRFRNYNITKWPIFILFSKLSVHGIYKLNLETKLVNRLLPLITLLVFNICILAIRITRVNYHGVKKCLRSCGIYIYIYIILRTL